MVLLPPICSLYDVKHLFCLQTLACRRTQGKLALCTLSMLYLTGSISGSCVYARVQGVKCLTSLRIKSLPETHSRTQGYMDSRCSCDWINSQCTMICLQTLACSPLLQGILSQSLMCWISLQMWNHMMDKIDVRFMVLVPPICMLYNVKHFYWLNSLPETLAHAGLSTRSAIVFLVYLHPDTSLCNVSPSSGTWADCWIAFPGREGYDSG